MIFHHFTVGRCGSKTFLLFFCGGENTRRDPDAVFSEISVWLLHPLLPRLPPRLQPVSSTVHRGATMFCHVYTPVQPQHRGQVAAQIWDVQVSSTLAAQLLLTPLTPTTTSGGKSGFVGWCEKNYLDLNPAHPEKCWWTSGESSPLPALTLQVKGQTTECAEEFKLGIIHKKHSVKTTPNTPDYSYHNLLIRLSSSWKKRNLNLRKYE